VADVSAVVIGGQIYVPGGRVISGTVTNLLEVYDPRHDRWEQRAALPVPLSAYAAVAFEGRLYVFGGWDGVEYRASAFEYDPSRDIWKALATMPTARGYAGTAVAGGGIYVIGGYDGKQALSVNEQYVPASDTGSESPWRELIPLPEGRFGMGIASIADIIYVVGGEGGSQALPPLAYFPDAGQWQSIEIPVTDPWAKPGLAVVETKLHVLGGVHSGSLTTEHFTFQAIYTINIPIVR